MPTIKLRDATPDDLELLCLWQTQPHVMAAGAGDDWHWEQELFRSPPWREQLIAEHESRAIGFVQIIDPALEDSHYWGDIEVNLRAIDIWLGESGDLGQGYGSEIMRQVLAKCFADASVNAVLVDPLASNAAAHRFYRRLGFKFVEDRCFDDDDCKVFRLDRESWNKEGSGD